MPAPTPNEGKIDNIAAVKMRETKDGESTQDGKGPYPRLWTGRVLKNDGKWVQKGYESGEYRIEIESKSLKDTVTARVNEDRKVGEKVQFFLAAENLPDDVVGSPITLGRFTESAIFKIKRKHDRSGSVGEWEDNKDWREDMDYPPSIVDRSGQDASPA